MITRAVIRYARISPRKVRPVIPLIKGKKPNEAIAILFAVKKRASQYLIDLLRSAIANTKNMQGIDATNLYISSVIANGGPQMKRFRAGSMGRASLIRKRTSHITIVLDSIPQDSSNAEINKADSKKAVASAKTKIEHKVAKASSSVSKKSKVKESTKPDSGKKGKE